MKQFWPLLCLVLLVAPHQSVAGGLGIDLSASGLLRVAIGDQDRRGKHHRDDEDNQPQSGGQRFDRGNNGGDDRRDDRINRAIAIASSRGRVLDAGPQGGSIFWVRVATERGRVDLLVDVDSGRIIGER